MWNAHSFSLLTVTFFIQVINDQNPSVEPFEVASVKLNLSAPGPGSIHLDQAQFSSINVPLRPVLGRAYMAKPYQIVGPAWLDTERYDIVATLPKGTSKEQVPAMLQVLLEQRFQMTLHRENRQDPIYALLISRKGPKLKAYDDVDGSFATRTSFSSNGHLEAKTLASLAGLLSAFMDHPVVDLTGIQGTFDIKLDVSPQDLVGFQKLSSPKSEDSLTGSGSRVGNEPSVSVFAALAELGLRLETRRAPIEHIIIDKIEKVPTEN